MMACYVIKSLDFFCIASVSKFRVVWQNVCLLIIESEMSVREENLSIIPGK